MRKLFFAAMLTLCAGVSEAVMPWQSPDAKWVSYRATSVVTSTAAVLVDVPIGKWARIGGWSVELDKVAAGTTTVKMGIVTSVNESSGTVRWFYVKTSEKNLSNTNAVDTRILWPATIDGRVVGGGPSGLLPGGFGTTPGFVTGDVVTFADAEALEYQNDVPLPTTNSGNVIPQVGDVILRVVGGGSTNPTTVTANLLYYLEP